MNYAIVAANYFSSTYADIFLISAVQLARSVRKSAPNGPVICPTLH